MANGKKGFDDAGWLAGWLRKQHGSLLGRLKHTHTQRQERSLGCCFWIQASSKLGESLLRIILRYSLEDLADFWLKVLWEGFVDWKLGRVDPLVHDVSPL